MSKSLYDLGLHETMEINDFVNCMRVPSGFIYDYGEQAVFVPYSDEFDPNKIAKDNRLAELAKRLFVLNDRLIETLGENPAVLAHHNEHVELRCELSELLGVDLAKEVVASADH